MSKKLLSIIELGGYPNFTSLFSKAGYEGAVVTSMRKALATLKKENIDLIIAEFNFQTDFRDRTSNVESLMATLQRKSPSTRVILIYDRAHEDKLERVTSRFPVHAVLGLPVAEADMQAALDGL